MSESTIPVPCHLCGATSNKCNFLQESEQCENLKLSNFKESAGPKISSVNPSEVKQVDHKHYPTIE